MSDRDRQVAFELFGASRLQEAKALCRSLLVSDATDYELWVLLSAIEGQLGEYSASAEAARKALDISPEFSAAHFNYGLAMMRLSHVDRAIESFQQTLRLQPEHSKALSCLGKLCDLRNESESAIGYYEKALSLEKGNVDLLCNLAFLYERTNQLEEASRSAKDALKVQPLRFDANLVMARVERRCGELDSARIRLQEILTREIPDSHVAEVYYELALVLDRDGDYENAFSMFSKCQESAKKEYVGRFHGERFLTRVKKYRRDITRDIAASWSGQNCAGVKRDPIFIVGFPRSGTTLTEQILSRHSRVMVSDEAELIPALVEHAREILGKSFSYPRDLSQLNDVQTDALREWYWSRASALLGNLHEGYRLVDKLPLNIIEICLIHRVFPGAPIVLCLRDPRDVCLSCFTQYFKPNDSMENFLSLEGTVRFYVAVMDLWEHYDSLFDLNVFKMRYEDLVNDSDNVVYSLAGFAGLEWEEELVDFRRNIERRKVSTPSYQAVASPLYTRSIGRWRQYNAEMGPSVEKLERFVQLYGYGNSQ